MVRINRELKAWLIGGAAFAAAWAIAGAIVRIDIGPMTDPDDFSPMPPLSALVAAILLVPTTATFIALALGRAVYLAASRLGRVRGRTTGSRPG